MRGVLPATKMAAEEALIAVGPAGHVVADGSFDALICSLGLMFFPDPRRGLSEFLRVLRPGGRAAASVLTVPERSYNGRINAADASDAMVGQAKQRLSAAPNVTFAVEDGQSLSFARHSQAPTRNKRGDGEDVFVG